MTSEFNPFNDFRDGPPRREQSVERELPLYDDEDDADEVIPETQFPSPIGIYIFLIVIYILFESLYIFFFKFVIFFF
jgi:hypothetical protein